MRIKGVLPGSPLDAMISDYFAALAAADYRTARVCLVDVMRTTSQAPVIEEVLRITHETRPRFSGDEPA